jgi:DNA-binding transcriptional MerR regulator
MDYTIKQLADIAGVSVRTLHYYDQIGLLSPESRGANRYRRYGDDSAARFQQIMFFRELGFSLDEIKSIISRPDFDMLEALESHRKLLLKKSERLKQLLGTVDRTMKTLKGEEIMEIKEYYQGFDDEQIEAYREEVRRRWGEDTLRESESRVLAMGKKKFAALQAEGGAIFKAIADNMANGFDSRAVQEQVAKWRQWLENFHHYPDAAVLELGRAYSQDARFAAFFRKIHPELPEFLTKAIEYYSSQKKR